MIHWTASVLLLDYCGGIVMAVCYIIVHLIKVYKIDEFVVKNAGWRPIKLFYKTNKHI